MTQSSQEVNPSLKYYQDRFDEKLDQNLNDFYTLLKFETDSISDASLEKMETCSNWISDYLKKIGFTTQIWDTPNFPIVFAHSDLIEGAETLLIYHHYDVQPVDPIELWNTAPFEPALKDGKIYARGASDNKGQLFHTLMALKTIYEKNGKFNFNIKLIIEGEEECGSKGLSSILESKKEQLKTDYLTVIDTNIPTIDEPTVSISARGNICFELELSGSNMDMHSGIAGGILYNPLQAMSEILANMKDKSGRVTIPGFYDDVKEYSDSEKKELYLDFDEASFEKEYDTKCNGGEKGFSPLERSGYRPTFEINGLWGGYTGDGFKTVLPAKAHAKVSTRLVPFQKAAEIIESFKSYVRTLCPAGMKLDIKLGFDALDAFVADLDSKLYHKTKEAFTAVFGKPCKDMLCAGSIPIIPDLQKACGGKVLVTGTALTSDNVHAPNEKFSIEQLRKGYLVMCHLVENF